MIFLIIALFSVSSYAQNARLSIKKVLFEGNKVFRSGTLLRNMDLKAPVVISESNLSDKLDNLLLFYKLKGYYYAQIDSTYMDINSSTYTIRIKEGELFTVSDLVIFNGDNDLREQLEANIPENGSLFILQEIETLISEIKEYYAKHGFPYVAVTNNFRLDQIDVDSILVRIELTVNKSKAVSLHKIEVTGAEYSKPGTIIRESRLKVGNSFSEDDIERAQEYITKLPFIKAAEAPELLEDPNGNAIINLRIEERNSNRFSGILGYIPGTNNADDYFIGEFSIDLGNILGTARVFQADWQKQDRNSQNLRIFYEEPWILGVPLNVNGEIEQVIQDSTYTKRKFALGLKYKLNANISAHAIAGGQQVIAEDIGRNQFDLTNTNSSFYTLGLSFNGFVNRLNPTKGIYYSTFFTQQNRKIEDGIEGGDNSVNDRKILAELEVAVPLKESFIVFGKAAWNQTTNSKNTIPISERWFLGGAGSLRGYREKQFLASKISWFNAELRYLFADESRIFLFGDGGFFQDPGDDLTKKFGYGFGLRVNSRLGLMGFDFGLGEGDTFSTAKLHFRIQNSF